MNEIQDERYHVADEAIYDAFFLVLKEKDLDKITVSDVIKGLGLYEAHFITIMRISLTLLLQLKTKLLMIYLHL